MSQKIEFNEEEVRKLYVNTLYTAEDVASMLGVGASTLVRFLRSKDIRKNQDKYRTILKQKRLKVPRPTREEVFNYYIEQNHSKKESAQYFKISDTQFSRWLKEYSLKKPMEKKRERYVIGQAWKKKPIPDLDELEKKYLNTDKTQVEVVEEFGVSLSTFRRWLMELNKHKDSSTLSATTCQSFQRKYGIPFFNMLNIQHLDAWLDKEKFLQYLLSGDHKKNIREIQTYFHVGQTSVFRNIEKFQARDLVDLNISRSSGEEEVFNALTDFSSCVMEIKNREILSGKELDIYIPERHIAIEYNGTYWHSDKRREKTYHYQKSLDCEKNGVRLIHIYEYEWKDPRKKPIIESLLKIALGIVDNKIYARDCEIRLITNKEAKPFNEKNHLQGHRNAQITYGLFYNGELVQLMSFSKTRFNRNLNNLDEWEIIRGCPGSNNIVVGGVSKLFKHFIKTHNPKKIFSYCDFNKFDGRGYEAIGMKFVGYTGPDLNWILPGCKVVSRSPRKHRELQSAAMGKLWGAGSKKYLWTP